MIADIIKNRAHGKPHLVDYRWEAVSFLNCWKNMLIYLIERLLTLLIMNRLMGMVKSLPLFTSCRY